MLDAGTSGLLAGGVLMGLMIAAPIGPVNIEMIHRGLREGFRGAFLVGLGSTVADLIYILIAYAGADPLSRQGWARTILFGAGALVLWYLGVEAIKAASSQAAAVGAETGEGPETGEAAPAGSRRFGVGRGPLAGGFLITILNPMTIAFWLGILSAALAARRREPVGIEMLYVASLAVGCLLWVLALSVTLHFGRRFVKGRLLRAVSVLAGLVLIGFGCDFAWKALGRG